MDVTRVAPFVSRVQINCSVQTVKASMSFPNPEDGQGLESRCLPVV